MAVPVPAGHHTVNLEYVERTLLPATIVAGVVLVLMAIFLTVRRRPASRRSRQSKARASEAESPFSSEMSTALSTRRAPSAKLKLTAWKPHFAFFIAI
jgi:hypothetical protein